MPQCLPIRAKQWFGSKDGMTGPITDPAVIFLMLQLHFTLAFPVSIYSKMTVVPS